MPEPRTPLPRRPGLSMAVVAAAFGGSVEGVFAQTPFVPVGDLTGGAVFSVATGVSADGSVVCGASSSSDGLEAYRFADGVMTGVGDLAGGTFSSYAHEVSGDGLTIIGSGAAGPASQERAFRWSSATGISDPGNFESQANGVSFDGSIVVGVFTAGPGHPFRWNVSTGQFQDLIVGLGPFLSGAAEAVSGDGAIIVGSGTAGAFRWTDATGMVALPRGPANASPLEATAISRDGAVIVGNAAAATFPVAFRWRQATGTEVLELPAGAASVRTRGVSGNGRRLVGTSIGPPPLATRTAVVWDQGVGWRTVKSLLEARGVNMAGWTLTAGAAISDNGRFVVGEGVNPSGVTEGWRADLPVSCPADFNGESGVTVQDIFDFLAAWFAGDSRADLDGVGGVSLQDIFDFLAAYFAGCAV